MSEVKTYIEFFYPDIFSNESVVEEVSNRDIKNVSVSDGVFGFRFFDVMFTEESGVKMQSSGINYSPMYYYGGRVMTLSEVRLEKPKDYRLLIKTMREMHLDRVIRCRTGNFAYFGSNDILIEV